jgi:hypothetical protein
MACPASSPRRQQESPALSRSAFKARDALVLARMPLADAIASARSTCSIRLVSLRLTAKGRTKARRLFFDGQGHISAAHHLLPPEQAQLLAHNQQLMVGNPSGLCPEQPGVSAWARWPPHPGHALLQGVHSDCQAVFSPLRALF